jgi:hypothetical protein
MKTSFIKIRQMWQLNYTVNSAKSIKEITFLSYFVQKRKWELSFKFDFVPLNPSVCRRHFLKCLDFPQ